MAVGVHDDNGEFVAFFPGHDPDKMDEGLALELAEAKALDAVVEAARTVLECMTEQFGVPRWEPEEVEDGMTYWSPSAMMLNTDELMAMSAALEAYDAAVAANRAHDSTAQEASR